MILTTIAFQWEDDKMTTKRKGAPQGMSIAGAIELSGGTLAVAEACEITRSAVSQWHRVPSRHLRTVAKLSGLSLEVLRPDLFGEAAA